VPNDPGQGRTDGSDTDGVEGDLRYERPVGDRQAEGYDKDIPSEEPSSLREQE